MRRLYIPLLLFFLIIFEGVALDLIPFQSEHTLIVPHFVLMVLVLVTVYYDKEDTISTILYGLFFGLMLDVVYTGILGVYMFSYGTVIYIVHKLKLWMNMSFVVTIFLSFIALFMAENFIYIIYTVINYTSMGWLDFLQVRFLPTFLVNVVFLLILYPIIVRSLVKWAKEDTSENAFW